MTILLLCALLGGRAFAAGTGDANSQVSDEKSLAGFCTGENKDTDPEQTGLCQSMAEQFNQNECMKKDVEKLRKRLIGEGEKDKDGNQISAAAPFSCNAEPPKEGSLRQLAEKNPSAFSNVLMQWIAMLISQKSNWNVLKDEDKGGKGPNGLLNLNIGGGGDTDMENPEYACGCKDKVATTSGQSGVTVEGQSPGPLDGHHTVTCGSYMIVHAMVKDNETGGGGVKTEDGKTTPLLGAARIIPELKTAEANDKKADKESDWRSKKMETFCKQFWKTGGETHPWKGHELQDIGGEQLKGQTAK